MKKFTGGEIKTLSEVQALTLSPGIAGKDILAKSNTGSGKTLAFLMVGVERILAHKGPDPKASFPIVILTPVTDLAVQIMQVAKQFLKYHGMEADLVIGGTDETKDVKRLTNNRIDVLVATPGRFKSLLNQSPKIKERLSLCQTFIIDEADKMTDPGFLGQTKFIHTLAMNSKMQTLAFSATMDKAAMMSFGLLKSTAVFIDAAAGTKPQVNTKVTQVSVITDISNHLDALVKVIKEQMKNTKQKGGNATNLNLNVGAHKLSSPTLKALKEWEMKSLSGYRIMIFLPSNTYIDYIAKVFKSEMPEVTTFSLHGGMQQNARSRTSEAFRTTSNCVMFTSDASARGVDYPDVSCVIQMGFDSRSEYLQRVGRTGRAGKDGAAYLITAPEENVGVELVCDVLNEIHIDKSLKDNVPKCITKNHTVHPYVPSQTKFPKATPDAKKAYRGWLGSLASKWKRLKMTPTSVVNMAQSLSVSMGLGEVPLDKLHEKLAIKIKPKK
jgi:ATP-dependent RNA helicase MSS116, mitochondrial